MLTIESCDVMGFYFAMLGMREPHKCTEKSDTYFNDMCDFSYCQEDLCKEDMMCYMPVVIGPRDIQLAKSLTLGGDTHAKFARMMHVQAEITAPLYWWKEYDTYKVGTTSNSESTMHTIHKIPFEETQFSMDHVSPYLKQSIIRELNRLRKKYLADGKIEDWKAMIQLLPSSYLQTRVVDLNYQVLRHIYFDRRNHKLDEWHDFCNWIETLPYAEDLITIESVA